MWGTLGGIEIYLRGGTSLCMYKLVVAMRFGYGFIGARFDIGGNRPAAQDEIVPDYSAQ